MASAQEEPIIDEVITVEDLFLSLKIISNIKRGDKLKTLDKSVHIDKSHLLQPITRWWAGQTRNENVDWVKRVIEILFEQIDTIYNKEVHNSTYDASEPISYFSENNSSLLQRVSGEMQSAVKGLENLKYTYKEDITIQSTLDVLIESINKRCEQIRNLLKVVNE